MQAAFAVSETDPQRHEIENKNEKGGPLLGAAAEIQCGSSAG